MDPLALKIRGNLQKFRQQTQAQYLKEWKIIQVVNLLAALILMLVALFPALWPIRHAVQVLIYAPLLIITSLFFYLKHAENHLVQLTLLGMIFTLLSLAAAFLHPDNLQAPSWLALLIPVVSLPILYNLFKESPHQSRRYSLRPLNWGINIAAGLLIGTIAAAHEYLILKFIPDINLSMLSISFRQAAWLIGVLAGLVVPAEELFFRGTAFSIYHDDLNHSFNQSLGQVGFFSMVMAIGFGMSNISSQIWLPILAVTVLYKMVLALINLFMVERWRNIWASGAMTLVFYLLIGRVFFL